MLFRLFAYVNVTIAPVSVTMLVLVTAPMLVPANVLMHVLVTAHMLAHVTVIIQYVAVRRKYMCVLVKH